MIEMLNFCVFSAPPHFCSFALCSLSDTQPLQALFSLPSPRRLHSRVNVRFVLTTRPVASMPSLRWLLKLALEQVSASHAKDVSG